MDKIIANVNEKGVVTIPLSTRKQIGIVKGGQVQIRVTADGLLLTPVASFPIEIYSKERLTEFAEEEKKLEKFKF